MRRRTEELVEVSAEVVDVSISGDEGDRLPVGVRARPEVPRVTGDVDARIDLGADGLNAGGQEDQQGSCVEEADVHTLPHRRARSCYTETSLLLAQRRSADFEDVHLVVRGARGRVASRGTRPDVVAKRGYAGW